MNVNRMRRRARDFAEALELEWEAVESSDVAAEAEGLDADWAVPILVQLWTLTLGHSDHPLAGFRSPTKRAIIELRSRGKNGNSKSHAHLMRLLAACQDAINEHFASIESEFLDGAGAEDVILLRGSGPELQLAADASAMDAQESLSRLARVLDGADPSVEFATLPHLKYVPTDPRYNSLWRGLFLRYAVLFSIARFNIDFQTNEVALLPRNFYSQSTFGSEHGMTSVIFTSSDIRELLVASDLGGKLGQNDMEITAYPLHPTADGYATSVALVLDSIAPWLQSTIKRLNLWTPVVSNPFEWEMLRLLRDNGVVAGSVSESGRWEVPIAQRSRTVQLIAEDLAGRGGSPGEIDGLGWHEQTQQLVLIECKSLNSIGNLQTVATTLSESDAAGWRRTLKKKVAWIQDACGRVPDLACVVLEGVEFFSTVESDELPVVHRDTFEYAITEAFGAGATRVQ
jgi:hypothetical protein